MRKSDIWHLPTDHLVLQRLTMGDVEDPYVYAAFPISEWQRTEKGIWVMEHALCEPVFHIHFNVALLINHIAITGQLSAEDKTYFLLRWGFES